MTLHPNTHGPRIALALEQIEEARAYTLGLLQEIPEQEWFRQPPGGVTHVGWQVGHLAMAEYRLCLERIRGNRPEDDALISPGFLAQFGKGSTPDPNPANNPAPRELLDVLAQVHGQVQAESADWTDEIWEETVIKPHKLFTHKGGSLLWCSRHEMNHNGQICLLRRLLGHEPVW